jgi:tetratricopeptide (TPR) repeat protein
MKMRHLATACLQLALMLPPAVQAGPPRYESGGTERDLNLLAEAQRAAYHGRYTRAIALSTEVIAGRPNFAAAYVDRANYEAEAGRYTEASADLDQAAEFQPQAMQIELLRATIALRQRNATLALMHLGRAAQMPPYSFWKQSYEGDGNGLENGFLHVRSMHTMSYMFAYASIGEEMLGHDDDALADLKNAMTNETDAPWHVLASHCFYAAVAGLLEMAQLTCSQAIAQQTHDIGDYDSLGLTHLKMHAWDKAMADYAHALANRPDLTVALYGRGIAKRARGDLAGGEADMAAARRDEPGIDDIMAKLGAPVS